MTRRTNRSLIAGLAARLTDTQDRESYSALVSYVNELPPGDEFRHLMEMLGFVCLLGERIPEAVGELLTELRAESKAAADYHALVEARLAGLPGEITSGVDAGAIAKAMSEVFRQQLSATGLQDTAALLKTSTAAIHTLSAEIAASLKPATQEFKAIASSISTDLTSLAEASRKVERHNYRLIVQDRSNRWAWQGFAALTLFLLGGICGIVMEKRLTADVLRNIGAQIERVQTPVIAALPIPRKNRK